MKIMIIEDDRTIRDLIIKTLNQWGFTTISVEDFENILQIYIEKKPHLVVMDINLPSRDGFYWCRRIREVSRVPMLFLSSRNTPMDMIMAMNMGGDDYIQKPFHMDVLIAKINALLRRTYSYINIQSHIFEHDGFVLDCEEGEISYGDQRIGLTKTEWLILKTLMQQKGVVVDRKKIMRLLWKDESFIDENTLTVNIARLRKKLGELGKKDLIKTKKGQGYVIS